jgi:protein-S-isoprenylcysteine O-methyltransferase Ste14
MAEDLKDSASISIPPPIYFFICFGFGILLDYYFPIHLINISPIPRIIVGGTFLLFSGYFAASSFYVLIKNKTTFHTSKATIKIVKEGAYRFSRNPLYLSLLLLLFSAAILLSSLWLFCAVPILYALFLFKAVKPEESYLSHKFGEEYLNYSKKVRRWV